ncbi:LysR family transcriptional regulator [Paractinoplanes toevensis]|uniref:LysR family transcriptional regulator n=1 Tax=Paractinoplanes toevensis TaxID=571911 RepID=A0A919W3P2_9ACTN|nr:LysR family transcriptional regulator [Actinoplanes toevensis]GIM95012.1 LysR family transcriptional regulator [Actinoplanes toevensis]
MGHVLDIVALRSLVAVADCGGFHRAATTLLISQSAVSQHVRRLEKVIGRPLFERQGRGAAFTPDGQALLGEARRILGAHDDALRRLVGADRPTVTVGTTEHAADLILPAVTAALPGHQVRFRIDRTRRLDDAVDRGVIDLAVHLAEASSATGVPVGSLPLRWYAAPGWQPPAGRGWPVVAIEEPCVLRRRALAALAARGLDPYVVCDSGYAAGVLDAVRSGLGVALMAETASTPDGVVARPDLPPVQSADLLLRARNGSDPRVAEAVAAEIRSVLGVQQPGQLVA